MNTFEPWPQDWLFPQPSQEQLLEAARQEKCRQDDMARMPPIPVMGDDHVPTMTLQELLDWKAKWLRKSRFTTASENLDQVECNRQIDELVSERETEIDWEEFERNEQEMDACPSPTQRNHPAWTETYQIQRELRKCDERREQRKRFLSPPRTPPHLRGSGLYKQQHASLVPNNGGFRITKGKRDNRKAPRRPITRSTPTPDISLHDRKGYVKYWHTMTMYVVISYEKYLRDYDREELDKRPREPMDFSREDPQRPHKTPYQREVCRRGMAQDKEAKNAILIPLDSWKGNK